MIKITNQDMKTVTGMTKTAEASDAGLFFASMQQAVQRGGAAESAKADISARKSAELPEGAQKRDAGTQRSENAVKPGDGADERTTKAEKDDSVKETKNDDNDIKDKDTENEEKPAVIVEAGAQAVQPEQQAAQDAQGNNGVQGAAADMLTQQGELPIQQGAALQEEAAQNGSTEAMSAQVQPLSDEQLQFVSKVLNEVEQQVVGNEAERTEPAAIQAQNATVTNPEAQAQTEDDFTAAGYDLHKEEAKTKSTAGEGQLVHQGGIGSAQSGVQTGAIPENAVVVELPESAPEARQAVFDNLLSQVESAVSEERSELYIRFKPEVFGGMAIRLSMTEEGVRAQIRTSDPTMRGMINSELSQLTDTLRARGIDVIEMELSYEQSANNQFLDQRSKQWQGQREQSGGEARAFTGEASEDRVYEAAYERMIPMTDENVSGVVYDA